MRPLFAQFLISIESHLSQTATKRWMNHAPRQPSFKYQTFTAQNIKQMFHCVFWTNALFFLPPNTTVYSYILQPLYEQQFSSRRPPTNSWLLPSYLIIGEEMCKKIGHKTIRCKYFAPWSNQSDRLKVPACVEAALYQHWQSINYGLIISQSRPVAPWVELQTMVRDDFTITEKATTRPL